MKTARLRLNSQAAIRLHTTAFSLREIAEMLASEEDHADRILNRYVRRDALSRDRIKRLDRTRTERNGQNACKTGDAD